MRCIVCGEMGASNRKLGPVGAEDPPEKREDKRGKTNKRISGRSCVNEAQPGDAG